MARVSILAMVSNISMSKIQSGQVYKWIDNGEKITLYSCKERTSNGNEIWIYDCSGSSINIQWHIDKNMLTLYSSNPLNG